MKVIILEDDRVENVADGYARNYLFPRKLAVIATPAAVAAVDKRKEKKQAEVANQKAQMQALAEKLGELNFEIGADAGEGGKLFGSVTSADIARAVKQTAGIDLDKRKIELGEPIKTTGEHVVPVKLFRDVLAKLKITVAAK